MSQHVAGHIEHVLGHDIGAASEHGQRPGRGHQTERGPGADAELQEGLELRHPPEAWLPGGHDQVDRILGHGGIDVDPL